MVKLVIFLLVFQALFTACSTENQPAASTPQPAPTPTEKPAPSPTPTEEASPEADFYDLSARIPLADSGYSIPYPANWFAEVVDNQLTISESLAQLDPPLTQPPLEGYAIDFTYVPKEMFITFGMPGDADLPTLLATATDFYNVADPSNIVETSLFGLPVIQARSRMSLEQEPEHPIEATMGFVDDRIFFLILHATDEDKLDAFLPTWRQMLDGIQADETAGEVSEVQEASPSETAAGWEMINSGGDALCADGTPAAFWLRPGDEDKLFIYFQGPYHNTFCLDAQNCDLDNAFPWIDGAVNLAEEFSEPVLADNFANEPQRLSGVFDFSNLDNPLTAYTAVYIPYCTGDLFMGDITKTYTRQDGTSFDIHHRGFSNAQAVLDIVYENLTAPEQVLVAGCEAGAPGALLQAPSIIEHYPEATVVQLSEGFAGIFPEAIDFDEAWAVRQNLPPALADLPEDFTITDLTAAIAQAYPNALFAQFNYAEDGVQATAYSTNGQPGYSGLQVDHAGFSRDLAAGHNAIYAVAPNFHTFTLQGSREQPPCALDSSLLPWLRGGETYYVDWLAGLLSGEAVSDVNGDYSFEAR